MLGLALRECKYCKKEFEVSYSRILEGKGKYCSKKCYSSIGKPKNKCVDCGNETSTTRAIRCRKCQDKFAVGINAQNWVNGHRARTKCDKEYVNRVNREWARKNPFAIRAIRHKRRLLTSDLKMETVQNTYEDNIKKYGTLTCYLCLKPIPFGKDHLEHKTPVSRGGTNERDNLDIACQHCNCRKYTRTVEEFKNLCS